MVRRLAGRRFVAGALVGLALSTVVVSGLALVFGAPAPRTATPAPLAAAPRAAPQTPPPAVPQAPPAAVPQAPPAAVPQAPPAVVPQTPPPTVPEAPALAVPQAPPLTAPQTPALAAPQKPPAAVPKAPALAVPKAPALAVPKAPALAVPEAPPPAASETPALAVPPAPARTAPQDVPTAAPQAPSVPRAETPAADAPTAAQAVAPPPAPPPESVAAAVPAPAQPLPGTVVPAPAPTPQSGGATWRRNAVAFALPAADAPLLAIVMTGGPGADAVIDAPVTLAVRTQAEADAARALGREVLALNPQDVLTQGPDGAAVTIPQAAGVVLDGTTTPLDDPDAVGRMLASIGEAGLMALDAGEGPWAVMALARAAQMPVARVRYRVADSASAALAFQTLREAARAATRDGAAVVLLTPAPETLAALRRWIVTQREVTLAPLSAVVARGGPTRY